MNEAVESPGAQWYGVYTRSRHEKMAATLVEAKGFRVFLPVREVQRELSASRTKKTLHLPLFPGYFFTNFSWDATKVHVIKSTHGVVSIVGNGQKPTPIPVDQIRSVERLVASGAACRLVPYLCRGQEVAIKAGPMRGLTGRIVRHKKRNLFVVVFDLLQRAVCVDLDFELLEVRNQISNSHIIDQHNRSAMLVCPSDRLNFEDSSLSER
jgi:transcription antitermination factor NusG